MTLGDLEELRQWVDGQGLTAARDAILENADSINDLIPASDEELREIGGELLVSCVAALKRGDDAPPPMQEPTAPPALEPASPPPPPAPAVAILDAIVAAPAVDEVAALLHAAGLLNQYRALFAENDIDLLAIPLLAPEHWRTPGVSLGYQVRILHATRELGAINGVVAPPLPPMVQAPALAAPVPAEQAAAPPAGQELPPLPPPPPALPPVAQELARAIAPPPPPPPEVSEPPPRPGPPTAGGSDTESDEDIGRGLSDAPPVAQAPAWFPAPDEVPLPPLSPAAAPLPAAVPPSPAAPRVKAAGRLPSVGAFAPLPLSPAAPPLAQAVALPPAQRPHVASAASAWVVVCTDLLETVKEKEGLVGLRQVLTSRGFKCGPTVSGACNYFNISVPPDFPCYYDLVGKNYASNQDCARSNPQLTKYLEGTLVLARSGSAYRTEAKCEADGGEDARRAALRDSRSGVTRKTMLPRISAAVNWTEAVARNVAR